MADEDYSLKLSGSTVEVAHETMQMFIHPKGLVFTSSWGVMTFDESGFSVLVRPVVKDSER